MLMLMLMRGGSDSRTFYFVKQVSMGQDGYEKAVKGIMETVKVGRATVRFCARKGGGKNQKKISYRI